MAKWTEEITYKFVQEYLKYECLYNCKAASYKIKGARDAALLRISEAMNIPGFGSKEVHTKIKNLKSTYSQENKKVKQSTKSGAGTDDLYNPQIKWFKLLDDALKAVNVQCSNSGSNMQLDSHEILDKDEPSTSLPNPSAENNNPDATPEFEDKQRKSPIPRQRTVRDLSRLVDKVKDVAKSINTRMATEIESEFDIFGKSVAAHLKSLPIHKAIEGQMFIQNYLCNLRLKHIGHGTSNYAYSPSPYTRPPRHSPYTRPPGDSPHKQPPQSSTPDPTNNVHNISPADQSLYQLEANDEDTMTLFSENNETQTAIIVVTEDDDVLARPVSSIY